MQKNLLFRAWTRCMRSSLLYFLVLFWVPIISAQTVPLTGTVSDAQGILPGVTVQIKNKLATTTTDANGAFKISASPDDRLVFSYVGYLTVEVLVGAQSNLNITLKEDATALDEVLVNAGYYKVKDKERTGSIAKITAKEIETQPVTNFLATMQGRMAGVHITQNNGNSGSGFKIQIRGQNSIRADGNTPLYVIDGVPYSSESVGNGYSMSLTSENTSPLNNLNPADVESIEVLKDADATAIYGSRGANGVVLITSKKGKKGKTRFNGSVSHGTGSVAHFMEMMNTEQYLAMRAEAFANDAIAEYPATAYDINGTWDPKRYTNWQEKLLGGTSKITNVNASVSGGSEQTQFLIGSHFNSESTVYSGDFGYKKSGLHLNVNHGTADQRFTIGFSGSYNLQDNDQPATDLSSIAWNLAPNAPALYDANGALNFEDDTFENPLALLNGKSKSESYNFVANSIIGYKIVPNLELKTNLGYTDLDHAESSTSPSTKYNPSLEVGSESSSIFYTTTNRESWIIEPQLNWKPTFGLLQTDFLVGATFQSQANKSIGTGGFGFSSNTLIYNPAAATTTQILTYDESQYKYQSYFGRANLNYKGTYLLNFTARRDGSSRFGAANRFGWFGAVGAAWIFSKEAFLAKNSILSFGKLRGSYGITGNDQIGNYKYLNTYTTGSGSYEGIIGLQPSRLYNPDFGWETNKKLEFAIETGFLDDRLFLTAAWYINRSGNQLVGIPLPGTAGFTQLQSNLDAVVENTGIELTLHTLNYKNKSFSWSTDINFSSSRNTLLSFPDLESSTYSKTYTIGMPLNIQNVYRFTGVDPATGLYTFEDVNGDGILTDAEDKVFKKDLNPSYFGGVKNHIAYNNWTLDFLLQFVKQDNYNIPSMIGVAGTFSNQPTMMLNHWQQPGDAAPYQLYTSGANQEAVQALYRYAASDASISDASYLRLKNVSISYDFPSNWIKNVKCRVVLEGQNLLTFTPYKGPDPEFSGIGFLPPLRIFTAGLQFNF